MRLPSEVYVLRPIPIAMDKHDRAFEAFKRVEYLRGSVCANVAGNCNNVVAVRLLCPQLADTRDVIVDVGNARILILRSLVSRGP